MTAGEEVGSVADEAARLADALVGWFGAASADSPETSACSCTACPLCRAIAAVRAVSPEVVEHLSAAASSLAAAVREMRNPAAPQGDS